MMAVLRIYTMHPALYLSRPLPDPVMAVIHERFQLTVPPADHPPSKDEILTGIREAAAVICMLSISEGASADEMRMIQLLGTKNIIVNSVKPPQTMQTSQGNTNLVEYGIRHEDLDVIRATVPHVAHVVPLRTVGFRPYHAEPAGLPHS